MTPSEVRLEYSTDEPLIDSKDDAFGRYPYAKRISETLINRVDHSNIVVAIYGKWGEGKTTLMNFIINELTENSDFVCIKFNPWRFSSEDKLINSFFMKLAESLEESLETKTEKIGEWIKKYLPFLGAFFSRTDLPKEIGKLLSNASLEEMKERIQGILIENNRQIVVFMDDIDRLSKEEIYSIFKLIKLTANFDFLTYILAFDDDVVADSLQERYGTFNERAGRRFLEKIVQVPINLPKISESELREFCFLKIDRLLAHLGYDISSDEVTKFVYNFDNGIMPKINNARVINRYINNLNLMVPVLYKETNMTDLLLIEGVKVVYPEIYEVIRDNPDLFLGTHIATSNITQQEKNNIKNKLDEKFQNLPDNELLSLRKLLSNLFPRLDTIYGNYLYLSDSEREWSRDKRIASKKYFDRYFLYTIPKNDVSDEQIDAFIRGLSSDEGNEKQLEELLSIFQSLVTSNNASNVIYKLNIRSEAIGLQEGIRLATIMIMSANRFPRNEQSGVFPFDTPFSRAAQIVAKQLDKIKPNSDGSDIKRRVLELSNSFPFSREIVFWMDKEQIEEKEVLLNDLAQKISKEFSGDFTMIEKYSDDFSKLLHIWSKYKSREEANKYIEDLIDNDVNNVWRILGTYNKLAYPMVEVRSPYKGDFKRDEYDYLVDTFEPKILYDEILKKEIINISDIDLEKYPYSDERDENLLVMQFVWLFKKVEKKNLDEG